MDIVRSNVLTEEQRRSVEELERVCNEEDRLQNRLFLSNEINFDRDIPVFFMAYEGAALIGFLTFFIPTREEAEISAVVRPAYRRKGVFTALDEAARRVIAENGISRTLYCAEASSESAKRVLERWDIRTIARSEYRMKRDVCAAKRSGGADFSVRRATPDNIGDYIAIASREYGEEEAQYADTVMSSDTRLGYVFYKDDAPIGVFVIGLETAGEPFIYGVAIAEAERGKGYGRLMMEQACQIGATHGGTLRLDVDSDNPVAFHLYRSIGFEIDFQVDYYVRQRNCTAIY